MTRAEKVGLFLMLLAIWGTQVMTFAEVVR